MNTLGYFPGDYTYHLLTSDWKTLCGKDVVSLRKENSLRHEHKVVRNAKRVLDTWYTPCSECVNHPDFPLYLLNSQ